MWCRFKSWKGNISLFTTFGYKKTQIHPIEQLWSNVVSSARYLSQICIKSNYNSKSKFTNEHKKSHVDVILLRWYLLQQVLTVLHTRIRRFLWSNRWISGVFCCKKKFWIILLVQRGWPLFLQRCWTLKWKHFENLQGGHSRGNLVLTFSRQGKHRENFELQLLK